MPLIYEEDFSEKFNLLVWNINESENDLKKYIYLNNSDLEKLSSYSNTLIRKYYLVILNILQYLNIDSKELKKDKNGAPYLIKKNKNISITNKNNIVAVVISDFYVGVDCEFYDKKIIEIKQKFIHKNEKNWFPMKNQIRYYTQLWTIKEAVYKVYSDLKLSFTKNIFSDPFNLTITHGYGNVVIDNKIVKVKLYFRNSKKYSLTIALVQNQTVINKK